jgi:hypothetical protein
LKFTNKKGKITVLVKILNQQLCDKDKFKIFKEQSSEFIREQLDKSAEIDVMAKIKQNWIDHQKNIEDVILEG